MFHAEVVEGPDHRGREAVRPGIKSPSAAFEGAPKSEDIRVPSPFLHQLIKPSPEPAKGNLLCVCGGGEERQRACERKCVYACDR